MKLSIQVTLLIFFTNFSFAQTKERTDYDMWFLQPDQTALVFSKVAYIRAEPSLQSKLIDSLSVGDSVKLIAKTKQVLSIKNIYAPWVKVSAIKNGSAITGYMWQGLLAVNFQRKNQETYLLGLDRIIENLTRKDEYDSGLDFAMQVKALEGNEVKALKEWLFADGESMNFNTMLLLGDTKLENLKNVVRISFGGEACGIPTNYYYAGFTGNEFLPLPGKMSVGDADVYSHSETLLFPNEPGGKAGQIIRLTHEESQTEEETDKKPAKYEKSDKKEIYKWDGAKAIKIK